MKVKAAIEKEYWLLMLSQPRPAPKPISEPPLSRLSHFVYNPSGHGGPEEDKDGVVPRSHSDTAGLGRWRSCHVQVSVSCACASACCSEACCMGCLTP